MKFDVKRAIIGRLRKTNRENVETVIEYMLKHGFFTRHCHSHHHYDGGLADHAWQTYQIALRLNAENHTKNPNLPALDEDSIAIAAILHDFCNCKGLYDISGHGRRSARMLKHLGFMLPSQEYLAVRFHMSLDNKTYHHRYNDALHSKLRELVHRADCISARLKKGCVEHRRR